MTNEQYIKALKKALARLDTQSRNDIVREIESHINEAGDGNQSLLERFGPVEILADQYLDGEPSPNGVGTKVAGISKKIFAIVGAATIVIIAAISVTVWLASGDNFNYANEAAEEITDTAHWRSLEWSGPVKVNVNQAHAVVYWHSENSIRWNCRGRKGSQANAQGVFTVRHGFCIVFLPQQTTTIHADQADVVVVRPQADLSVSSEQSSVRIAENDAQFVYDMSLVDSDTEAFSSHDNAPVNIEISARESTLSHYRY